MSSANAYTKESTWERSMKSCLLNTNSKSVAFECVGFKWRMYTLGERQ